MHRNFCFVGTIAIVCALWTGTAWAEPLAECPDEHAPMCMVGPADDVWLVHRASGSAFGMQPLGVREIILRSGPVYLVLMDDSPPHLQMWYDRLVAQGVSVIVFDLRQRRPRHSRERPSSQRNWQHFLASHTCLPEDASAYTHEAGCALINEQHPEGWAH